MNNKYPQAILIALGGILATLWVIYGQNKRKPITDANALNNDWAKLHGDFSRATTKFKSQYGA